MKYYYFYFKYHLLYIIFKYFVVRRSFKELKLLFDFYSSSQNNSFEFLIGNGHFQSVFPNQHGRMLHKFSIKIDQCSARSAHFMILIKVLLRSLCNTIKVLRKEKYRYCIIYKNSIADYKLGKYDLVWTHYKYQGIST